MPKYQIEFNRGGSLKSFKYFISEKGDSTTELACQAANEALKTFNGRPPRVLSVREMDMEKKKPKRGGHKFKLHLVFFEATFTSGRKERDEWYQYND